LSFSVITDDLTLTLKDQNVVCIVNCKEDYDNLKLACKPIFQKIYTLYVKASIEVEGKHFDLDILMGGDMKFLQLMLGLGGSLCNYSCPWNRVHENHKRADNMLLPS
jgi:transcriptional antiterminator Rof (Rho-off)